jgi:RNA polymerase sigma-70 factor, ECF subfamily
MEGNIPELIERFSGGDSSAFADLVKRYQKRIYYLAYQMLGNHLDADEVVQETFVRVYRKRKEIRDVANFTSFLIRIATNYSIDLLRKQKGHSQLPDDPGDLPGDVQVELSRRVRTPEDLLQDKVLSAEIQRALATLPPRQKITALLHDVEGYTKTEIARILDCPEATVRSNLHIARKKLKKILQKRLAIKE